MDTNDSNSKVGAVSHCTINKGGSQSTHTLQVCGGTPHLLQFVDMKKHISIKNGKLPHWNQNGCVQFVTFRLADSLPQVKLAEYREMKENWIKAHPEPWDKATQDEYDRTIGCTIDKWLNSGYGRCILKDESARTIIANAILHFNGDRYNVHAYVIMPNHVHVLVSPMGENEIQTIVESWKKFSAHGLNKLFLSQGAVWCREHFDRMIRNEQDFFDKLNYIVNNPINVPVTEYSLGISELFGSNATEVGAVSHCTLKEKPIEAQTVGKGEVGAVSHCTINSKTCQSNMDTNA